ncbi:glutathione S-transferase N-terminal domain-containing protein [Pseudomonas nitroreducens]|uniref:Glutathione S-transferase N-terminal domain-containing protein n=1 Tax=Pseudomonas nitroreducens TaxID=46680 RepID=A0ABS0KHA3_PSENT|nr:glutathione S-transferase N-terminal domain-containing protein [Pseudomonas nitroreducens]MBG6287408.1 glutathione S-transferase N-terminal domain-containing protein [Pseudomonas nitroreducens]MDG9854300.1 glutathione S-transferase N-terminal domain-containing protein [Pseudomonas nitroreducens]MDH1073545.1 glutathione S-transferase N-terminal domain-containing protein [Pseudomonas nitroreducens]NMZ74448.1 glutathione S-transferase [Pseudomonas nitroreducens]
MQQKLPHLIGMLDSPYVRRVAITLRLLGIEFSHQSLSVFRTYEEFRGINPVVKAPTLVLSDGQVLMDSTLIIDCLEHLAGRSLMPAEPAARVRATRLLGLALAVMEKAVQRYYEQQRPDDKQLASWQERVDQQLHAALAQLESELREMSLDAAAPLDQAGLSIAVAWTFVQLLHSEDIPADSYPAVGDWAQQAEALEVFKAFPPV